MLQLCAAADEAWLWDLLDLVPTPAHAAEVREEQVSQVLQTPRMRRVKAHEGLTCLQTAALPVAPGVAEAAQAHCQLFLPCLRVLAAPRQGCARAYPQRTMAPWTAGSRRKYAWMAIDGHATHTPGDSQAYPDEPKPQ